MHFPLSFCKNASPYFSMVHLRECGGGVLGEGAASHQYTAAVPLPASPDTRALLLRIRRGLQTRVSGEAGVGQSQCTAGEML